MTKAATTAGTEPLAFSGRFLQKAYGDIIECLVHSVTGAAGYGNVHQEISAGACRTPFLPRSEFCFDHHSPMSRSKP